MDSMSQESRGLTQITAGTYSSSPLASKRPRAFTSQHLGHKIDQPMPDIMHQAATPPYEVYRTITMANAQPESQSNPYQPTPGDVRHAVMTENYTSLSGASHRKARAPRRRLSTREDSLEPKRKARKSIGNPLTQVDNQHGLSSARYNSRNLQGRNDHRSNASSRPHDYQMEIDSPGLNSLQPEISPILPPRTLTTNNSQENEQLIGEYLPSTPSKNHSQPSSEFVTPAPQMDRPFHLEEPSPALSPEYITIDEAFIPRSFVPEDPFVDGDRLPYTNSETEDMEE